jgi:hypothetical protein
MGSLTAPFDRLMRRLGQNPLIAGIVLTVVTIALIGGVVLTMTAAGCGPANALGIKGIATRCAPSLAARTSPSSPVTPTPSSSPVPTPVTSPVVNPPPPVPPVVPPVSAPNPPANDPGSPAYPTVTDASGSIAAPSSINCRLPVYVGPPGSGGFIVFPGNTFIADPNSGVSTPSPSPGGPTPAPAPGYGYGAPSGLTYDKPYSRWLPVPMQAVSSDGARYAFATADGIYVVSVSSGAMTEVGQGRLWTVTAMGASGVYATVPNTAGLWLLPYSGASPRQLISTGYWQAVGGGAAYGTPTSAVPQGTPSTIQKLDLSTNVIVDYFTRAGSQSYVAGFDAQGTPIIYANGASGSEVWIGSLFLMARSNMPYGGTVGFSPSGAPAADSHGVWFSGYYQNGYSGGGTVIVVYIPGSGVYAVSSIGAQLAGGCY